MTPCCQLSACSEVPCISLSSLPGRQMKSLWFPQCMVCGAHAVCFPSNDEKYITTDHYVALNFLPLVIFSMHSDLHVVNDDYICLISSFSER
jgi:hypothetical protein